MKTMNNLDYMINNYKLQANSYYGLEMRQEDKDAHDLAYKRWKALKGLRAIINSQDIDLLVTTVLEAITADWTASELLSSIEYRSKNNNQGDRNEI